MVPIETWLAEIDNPGIVQDFLQLTATPEKGVLIFKLQEDLMRKSTPQTLDRLKAFYAEKPAIRAMVQERYLPLPYDTAELSNCPPGTFGYAYYHHLTDNGLSANFFPPVEPVDDYGYIRLRIRQTHDIWHVLAGFDTSIPGELGLQAFCLAQWGENPFSMIILGSGLLNGATVNPHLITPIMDEICRGWQMGKAARPVIGEHWEERWNDRLDAIRQEFCLS